MRSSSFNNGPIFLPDEPITDSKQDRLNRLAFIKSLANQMIGFDRPECLVIGIHGPWGSGKSSVLNLLASELEQKGKNGKPSVIVVRFNPWNFSTIDQLILMFFHELSSALKRHDKSKVVENIGTVLETFGEILSPLSILPMGESAGKIMKLLGGLVKRSVKRNNLLDLKAELNRLLKDYGKKIVILVDDIDRLDKESIRLMFRLIRLNADFNNLIYVLAFDRGVVEKVLESEQEISGRDYLEKIIQVSFDLPVAEQSRVATFLFEELDKVLVGLPEQAFDQHRWGNLYHAGFKTFFKTVRDVKRFANAVHLNFPSVREEINPVDFIGLEAIRVFHPEVYTGLAEKKEILTRTEGFYGGARQADIEAEKKEIEELFGKAGKECKAAVKDICRQLFPQLARVYENTHYGPEWKAEWRREKRICAEDIFDKYFLLGVPEGEIAEAEINTALQSAGDRNAFADVIREFNKRGLVRRFLERLEDFTKEFPVERVEATIGALVDAGDELPLEKRGMYDFGADDQIIRIVYQLLKRLDNRDARIELLKNLAKTGAGLYTIIHIVSVLEPKDKKDQEPIITEEGFREVKNIVIERIRQEAKEDNLLNRPNLAYILFRWQYWSTKDEPKNYVSNITQTDQGIIKLLTGFLQESHSHSLGDYIAKRKWRISKKTLSEFINPEDLQPKVELIKEKLWKTMSDQEKRAIDAFLSKEKEPLEE